MLRIEIDSNSLLEWVHSYCRDQKVTRSEMAGLIGKSGTYFYSVAHAGYMPGAVYDLLCKTFSLPKGSFQERPKDDSLFDMAEAEDLQEDFVPGYHASARVNSDTVEFLVTYCTETERTEICRSYSRIKEATELEVLRAFAIAARSAFICREQEEFNKGE